MSFMLNHPAFSSSIHFNQLQSQVKHYCTQLNQHKPTLLVTGATGYIASHTWLSLIEAGYQVIGIDNLSNSHLATLNRLAKLLNCSVDALAFHDLDVMDANALNTLIGLYQQHLPIAGVVHFAALKAVGESVKQPLKYYQNNLIGLLSLLEVMEKQQIHHLIFSSSATVYGFPEIVPITENAPLSATNPYGQTKLMAETILRDIQAANTNLNVAYLRYFNPIGAHPSGLLGELPQGIPNNLMPYITQVANKKLPYLQVFGDDYSTIDGTGVRDYIHVCDLAAGHVKAMQYLQQTQQSCTVNLGTGQGYSVLQMIKSFEGVNGVHIPYKIVARRAGDCASCYADPSQAKTLLNWQAQFNLEQMCKDAWQWELNLQALAHS